MLRIPLQPVPSQTTQVTLGAQICQVNVYQHLSGLYCDLYIAGALIIGGVICQNRNRIVRDVYLGFSGDLFFVDTQGDADPYYTGLGDRFQLVYASPDELAAAGLTG